MYKNINLTNILNEIINKNFLESKNYITIKNNELIFEKCIINEFANIDIINNLNKIINSIKFKNCDFNSKIYLKEKNDNGSLDVVNLANLNLEFNSCTFNQDVAFNRVTFEKKISFYNSNFRKNISFRFADFKEEAYFRSCKFYENSYFSSVKFNNNAKFHNSTFYKDVYFHRFEVDKDFENINDLFKNIEKPFRKPELGRLDFSNATILGKCDLSNSTISHLKCEHLSLSNGTSTGSLILKDTDLKDATRESFAYLKNYFENKKDDISRDEYYIKEMKKDFKSAFCNCEIKNLPTHFYMYFFSNYGTSWIRPLMTFIIISLLIIWLFNSQTLSTNLIVQIVDPTNISLTTQPNDTSPPIDKFELEIVKNDFYTAIWYIYKLFSLALIYSFINGLKARTRGK